jgi:4-diphosphocytidyl-2-C-methyl-D-erythritol kinase
VTSLKAKSLAKINLFLHIMGRRKDDYHELDSLVVFTEDVYDVISIELSDHYQFIIDGPFANKLIKNENIITLAVNLLSQKYQKKPLVKINLTKNLPVASGIGGGSSNAATAIKLLCKLWNLSISDSEMISICKNIGADVPMFIINQASYFNGIGEILTPLKKIPNIWAILVNPGISVSTPEIFKMGLKKHYKQHIYHEYSFNKKTLISFLKKTQNDLYFNSLKLVPSLSKILDTLASFEGCEISRMSGSGATCFGIFSNVQLAETALKSLQIMFPNYWIKLTKLK